MARVRLYLTDLGNQTFQFVRPGGIRDSIPVLRLCAFAVLTPHVRPGGPTALRAAFPPCILDTGSPLSIIPEYIWSHFYPNAYTPLSFDTTMPLADQSVSVGSGNYHYELCELTILLRDRRQNTMNLRVVAKRTLDGGRLRIPLTLGLRGGVIDGRILHAEPDPNAPFSQAWFLEDP